MVHTEITTLWSFYVYKICRSFCLRERRSEDTYVAPLRRIKQNGGLHAHSSHFFMISLVDPPIYA
jgi:hypothetical protein